MDKYLDENLSFEERAKDLCEKLTVKEKVGLLISESKPVERLNIPAYDWWNEALHGLARSGIATVFPQAIAMAATWNKELLKEVADIISTECRAKSNAHKKIGHVDKYVNTNVCSPNINIFRDPRWGRGHETYGECPTLTGEMGKAFVLGMQGNGKYLKTACCAKHYAVHSGPEANRHTFDSNTNEKDLYETYLPAFETLVKEAKVENIMSAYNSVDNIPMSANHRFLTEILRDEFGFKGTVISDAGAASLVLRAHHYYDSWERTMAEDINAGMDLNMIGPDEPWNFLEKAMELGYITEDTINVACQRVLTSRLKMGLFAEDNEYTEIPYSVIACEEHKKLSEKAAVDSIVMLKNDGILPLDHKYKNILVVGPNAQNYEVNYGNYYGTTDSMVTVFDGIRDYAKDCKVSYTLGTTIDGSPIYSCVKDLEYGFYEAEIMAEEADLIIYVGGLNSEIEGEVGDATNSLAAGDRLSIELPGRQNQLIDKLASLGKPFIVINIAGGPVSLNNSQEKANAVLSGLYLGERAGNAMAKVLFGEESPCGKLPYTVPYTTEELPPFEDYSMVGRTYRYMKQEPLYPFGFGLSYSKFEYSDLQVERKDDIKLTFKVKNIGNFDAKEICQAYISILEAPCRVPIRDLVDFTKISLKKEEEKIVTLTVPEKRISYIDMNGKKQKYSGKLKITVGSSQGDKRSLELGMCPNLTVEI